MLLLTVLSEEIMKIPDPSIQEAVSELAGNDVIPLVKALKNKKNVSEFKLADDINEEINKTRNMLYRLYNANLVSFIRKKDKKKGWYIHYWTFNVERISYLINDLRKKKIERLRERLDREKNTHFYNCKNKCIRLEFDQSIDFNFKCPECGLLLNPEDNQQKIQNIEKEIVDLEKVLSKKIIKPIIKEEKILKKKRR